MPKIPPPRAASTRRRLSAACVVVALVLVGATCAIGCRARSPDTVLAEADAYRVRYERAASTRALELYGAVLEGWRGRDLSVAARAAHGRAATFLQLGRLADAVEAFALAKDLSAGSTDRRLEAEVLGATGYARAWAGYQASDFDSAAQDCERALTLARQQAAVAEEAAAIGCAAEVLYFRGTDLERALALQREAETLWRRANGNRGIAEALYAQGYLQNDLRRFADAEKAFEAARTLWETIGDRRGLAITRVGEARMLERRGEYLEALEAYDDALAMLEPMDDLVWVASCLAGQAQIHQYLAEHPQALEKFERAFAMIQASGLRLFEWDLLTAIGETLVASGDESEALARFDKAHALAAQLANPRLQAWALAYSGGVHVLRQDADRAGDAFRRADVLLTGLDEKWLQARVATGLAETAELTGDLQSAQRYFDHALAVSRSAGDRARTARGLHALGNLEARQGRYDPARARLNESLSEYRDLLGPAHPLVADARASLARVDLLTGRRHAAFAAAVQAEASGLEHLRLTVRHLPERQALSFAARRPRGLHMAIAAAVMGEPHEVATAYDLVIQSRGVILDELAARSRTSAEGSDSVVARAQQRYANLLVRSLDGGLPPDELDQARREKENAERALAATIAGARPPDRVVGIQAVRSALPPDSALISFVFYEAVQWPGHPGQAEPTRMLAAFVLHAGTRAVDAVSLGPAAVIDTTLAEWRRAIADAAALGGSAEAGDRTRSVGERMRRMVWDPLAPRVSRARHVFVVPDGDLALLPLPALPAGPDAFLLERISPIHYLSAERDIVPVTPAPPSSAGMLAIGSPEFDQAPGTSGSPVPPATPPAAAQALTGLRGAWCGTMGSLRFLPLSGTLQEVRDLSAQWPSALGGAELLTGERASERAFKTGAGRHRVLHVATHGFFLDAFCAPETRMVGTRGVGGLARATPLENPLRLSGLALAGANLRARAKADDEDGILTAEEVAMLNLQGVEWAVLSACDTGVGEIKAGEGVFGLRRAFQVAGARTVIMSLWSVEDEATRAWMRALYEGRFQRELSTADAVHQASLTVLRDRRARGLSTHPFFWAAFVAAGDWR